MQSEREVDTLVGVGLGVLDPSNRPTTRFDRSSIFWGISQVYDFTILQSERDNLVGVRLGVLDPSRTERVIESSP